MDWLLLLPVECKRNEGGETRFPDQWMDDCRMRHRPAPGNGATASERGAVLCRGSGEKEENDRQRDNGPGKGKRQDVANDALGFCLPGLGRGTIGRHKKHLVKV